MNASTRRPALVVVAALTFSAAGGNAGQSPQSPGRPRLTGINHVAFRVSDAAQAGQFYEGLLGLRVVAPPVRDRLAFVVNNRQRVILEPGLPPGEEERLSHLSFETSDLRALVEYLRSRGMQPQPTSHCVTGAVRVTDPDGHAIEFVQGRWPPAMPDATRGRELSDRLLHAGLVIRDEEVAHRFYRDALGFSEIWRGGRKEGVTQWVNMRVPDGTDYLEYMLVTSPPDRRQRGVLHHLALLVPDIQAAWEEVVRRTPEESRAALGRPQVGVNGRWQLNLFDHDGTRTELMEPFTVR